MRNKIILLACLLLFGCRKSEEKVEVVVVSVYSLPIKYANYNEPQKNYYHIAQTDGECYVLVRSYVVSDFEENKFVKQPFPKEVYNSTFETRFDIPKYFLK